MRDIRVATVQFQPAASDKACNLGRIRHFVTEAGDAQGAVWGYYCMKRNEKE